MGNEEEVKGDAQEKGKVRGFMQVAREHKNSDSISYPVTNEATIRLFLCSILFSVGLVNW